MKIETMVKCELELIPVTALAADSSVVAPSRHRGDSKRQKQGRLSGVGSGAGVPVGGGIGGDPGTNNVLRK